MALPTPTVAPQTITEIRQGKEVWIWVTSVAAISTPTSAELTAGTAYQAQIATIAGFAPSGSSVDAPNLANKVVGNASGLITLGTGTVTFNLSKTPGTTDARTAFNDGADGSTQTAGYWYRLPEGIVTSAKMRGYAATVLRATESSDPAAAKTLEVEYSLQQVTGFITVPTV